MVSNLSPGSAYLWAHLLVFLLICTATYATVLQFLGDFLRLRRISRKNLMGEWVEIGVKWLFLARNGRNIIENGRKMSENG
jgi:hypothetical protein